MKLVSEKGRWALRDNSMIFTNIVVLPDEKSKHLYHLIDENRNEIEFNLDECFKNDD
jgi:hypothetical protein